MAIKKFALTPVRRATSSSMSLTVHVSGTMYDRARMLPGPAIWKDTVLFDACGGVMGIAMDVDACAGVSMTDELELELSRSLDGIGGISVFMQTTVMWSESLCK